MRKILVLTLMIFMGMLACSINIPLSSITSTADTTYSNNTNLTQQSPSWTKISEATSMVRANDIVNTQVGNNPIYLPTVFNNYSTSFSFASWGDAQDNGANLPRTSSQVATLSPAFTIFNGDLEDDGFDQLQMNVEVAALNGGDGKNNGLFNKTFLVRGNHDDHTNGSAALWENFFSNSNRSLPSGVTNYIALDSSSTFLTYSFDYGNSRFIGADVPGDADLLTSAEASFIDKRLADAETKGLIHAFLFFHGPEYCVESTHCNCVNANDSSCTPGSIINLINKHPIVSATFHGHEHILGWVHMSNARVSGLTHAYEEFLTSPSGSGTYNSNLIPARMDYVNMVDTQGFAVIEIKGATFTVNLYRVGTAVPVWSKTFTK
jgi:hypothetical protein